MAQYKTHSCFNLLVGLPILIAAGYYFLHTPWPLLSIFGGCFIYATLFMSPDMDLANQIRLRSVRGMLTSPFRLYSKLFSHRGLSHSILFGTLTRVGFLALLALIILFAVNQALPTDYISFLKANQTYLLYALAGIFAADLCHLLLDL